MDYSDDKHEGDAEIVDDLQLDGMITGTATVKGDVFLQLNGMVGNSLIIESGGSVELNGTVRKTWSIRAEIWKFMARSMEGSSITTALQILVRTQILQVKLKE